MGPIAQSSGFRAIAKSFAADGWDVTAVEIDAVIVGCDRVAANGDTANKIGTYSIAVLADAHDIPFYVAAPSSTFDLELASGDRSLPESQGNPD